jgi:glutamate synthase domain-containing protein 2/glutamate synthase domain-containing protein 1/glutamate synthase domain-containing protein 3
MPTPSERARTRAPQRVPLEAPLYDPSHEHDACGIGFVADAGGRSRERVLPLALAGLAALGHRGAFAADGASSDGAGVLLPLEAALLARIAPALAGGRPGVLQLFLPRGRRAAAEARALVETAVRDGGLRVAGWRRVPAEVAALGTVAAATRPAFEQAFVARPGRWSEATFERCLIVTRRRIETAARAAGASLAVASASCRTVVYKGLVAGDRLDRLFPDLAAPLPLRFALFHQRYATNTAPEWHLAQPFRHLAHNGEINTVRANREQFRGRTGDTVRSHIARALLDVGPLVSAGGSDSLSLDEAVELLLATGWDLSVALLALLPEALPLRLAPHPHVASLQRRTAGFLAPWDGPAALVFSDGRHVGALLDRNGLRPAAFAVTREGVVAVASEAGAVPLAPAETMRRGRLGPGELLLVDLRDGSIREDVAAKAHVLRRIPIHDAPRPTFRDSAASLPEVAEVSERRSLPAPLRYLAGLDAEGARLHLRTMAVEGHEPLWSMGDDTPLPGLGRVDRPVTDYLRQAFAQVTNPPIDAERERAVLDLRVELGRRPPLLGGVPVAPATLRLERPVVADLDGLLAAFAGRLVRLQATWDPRRGAAGLAEALEALAGRALRAARRGCELLVVSDRGFDLERLPVPAILAVGAVHTALTAAGLRGRTDIVSEAADVLDVHVMAMTLAVGASAVVPWLALECAAEYAGGRGSEALSAADAAANLLEAFEGGLRKTLARAGLSTVAAYVGGALFETLELDAGLVARCFPAARSWPGRVDLAALAARQLRRRDRAGGLARLAAAGEARLPDPGLARFRSDGEMHLYAPRVVQATQALATQALADEPGSSSASGAALTLDGALDAYRAALARHPAVVRDGFRLRRLGRPVPLDDVESARAIARRFVVSAMSVGALSPEAHQALTLGIQRAGGAANTGEGGEDPAWYMPGADGERRDARIKQVASARFGVTAAYLARAEQLEIKIAQGSKPGEGGQLPGRKVTAYIAALRRAQPGQALISPPPHHDIYSIEDLAQLIADLRAINPRARIGVKLVATRGVGTIAAGVVKAGATYVQLSGHSGGTGASPLASIKHVGVPWELGLAEVHQVLLHHGLRDRVALRTDGGLQSGRDLLVAALLGAEEFAFGTLALVALGCDMARQCHLDTCPTGIATQRADLRAKFKGTPEQVERFALALAEDLRRELAAIGARSVGEVVGEARRGLAAQPQAALELGALIGAPRWPASPARRADPVAAATVVPSGPASPLEARLASVASRGDGLDLRGLVISNADRSFGAMLSGARERGQLSGTVRLGLVGSAGQSFGAFAGEGLELKLRGPANDYVAKGLSGATVVVTPEADLAADPAAQAIAGNACLYGATAGRLHVVGRAGMRFAVRNSGATAVVEGVGAHGCEYMTGGVVVVLGHVGPNFGAGMSGGRAYLLDPEGLAPVALHAASVTGMRLAEVIASRPDGWRCLDELRGLLRMHREAGSATAADLLALRPAALAEAFWLVEPRSAGGAGGGAQPDRNLPVSATLPTDAGPGDTVSVSPHVSGAATPEETAP